MGKDFVRYIVQNRRRLGWLLVLAIFVVMLPFSLSEYKVDLIINLFINIILVSSFRLIATTGGWSLAHVAMMGCGAYATALLSSVGIPFWFSLPLSGLAAAMVASIISYPLARTTGFAFFVASFAAGDALRVCWTRFKVPFGGHQGLSNVPVPKLFPAWDFSEPIPYYFLTLVVMLLCLAFMRRLDKSRIGDTWKCIEYQEDLAKALGINSISYKMMALIVGSFFAGVGGVLLAHRLWAVVPGQFGFAATLYLLIWVVFGGLRTFHGPILGVVSLTILQELLRPLLAWVPMIYGAIIILTLIFFPEGLEGLPQRTRAWLSKADRLMDESKGGSGGY